MDQVIEAVLARQPLSCRDIAKLCLASRECRDWALWRKLIALLLPGIQPQYPNWNVFSDATIAQLIALHDDEDVPDPREVEAAVPPQELLRLYRNAYQLLCRSRGFDRVITNSSSRLVFLPGHVVVTTRVNKRITLTYDFAPDAFEDKTAITLTSQPAFVKAAASKTFTKLHYDDAALRAPDRAQVLQALTKFIAV